MASYDAKLRRGAFINLVGLVGKIFFPLFLFVVAWVAGPETFGLYLLAVSLAEILVSAVQSGFIDAVMIFASRHVDHADTDPAEKAALYRVLAAGFGVPVVVSLLLAVVLELGATRFVALVYPDRPSLARCLEIIGFTLPFIAISQACIAATRAKMIMEYEALLNGFARPVLLLGSSVAGYYVLDGVVGLVAGQLVAYVLLSILAVVGYSRHFELAPLLAALREGWVEREVLRFAIPQSLNMTFNKYLGRLDVMMLGAMGYEDFALGLFGAAATLTINIREIKLIFSQALGPIVVRHHVAREVGEFEAVLGRVSRWSTSLAVPVVLLVAALRTDILHLMRPEFVHADNAFMLILLIPPFLSCAYGLAGNCIVFTGHSSYNLLNSVLVAALNTVFNLVLIPRYGLVGAATATALASFLISMLQLVELAKLEGVVLRLRHVWKPHLGLVLGFGVIALFWDPASLPGLGRAALAGGLVVGYGLLMLAVDHEEVVALAKRSVAALRRG